MTRFVVRSRLLDDPRARGYLADALALGLRGVTGIECQDLFWVKGAISSVDLRRLASQLLADPVSQVVNWERVKRTSPASHPTYRLAHTIEVALLPGVTDPVAEQTRRAAKEIGIETVEQVATGLRFVVRGPELREADLHTLARRLLANPTIQHYCLGEIEPGFPNPAEASQAVEVLLVRHLDEDALLALSQKRLSSLNSAEMKAIKDYFVEENRDPTDIEFETIAQTWSEHCSHKTFKAKIELKESGNKNGPQTTQIFGILNTYLRAASEQINAPWVRSAFVDNAGVIDFDEEFEVSFKVETHNHPSAIEPFGGANTGVGGVIRDILGVSARPIANTDVLCFGPIDQDIETLPEGVLHPRRIRSGVVAGIQDYGNKIGIPTVNGAVIYDIGFTANPLVYCGCVGLAPKGSHRRDPRPGDRVVVLGGRTGRDGLRGATFSSMTMDAQTGEVSGASVQIGDPITEKGLIEVCLQARDQGLYHAITDCGAGGLSSAVGEMASQIGAEVDLSLVPLKYPGLAPWEIWLSEAQERMVLAVPPESMPELTTICHTYQVEITDIGMFTGQGRLVVRSDERVLLDLDNNFLHHGMPRLQLRASSGLPAHVEFDYSKPFTSPDYEKALIWLLAHPNIASKANIIRVYDHEVQGGTVVKPLTGKMDDGPSDACVIKPLETHGKTGIVLSNGINPEYGKIDPYRMAVSIIDEAIRNAVCVGGDPDRIALLDNFCWGDPGQEKTLGSLVAAARGCYDAALSYRTPFISGKDSLNNEYMGSDGQRHAIPPTLLISAIGIIPDVEQAVTMDLKEPGDFLYLLGKGQFSFAGSHFTLLFQPPDSGNPVPGLPTWAPDLYRALHAAMRSSLVRACHDLSEGGLAVAAAEMAIAGRMGMDLNLEEGSPLMTLFGEGNGRLLVEVRPEHCQAFETQLTGLPFKRVGNVSDHGMIQISLRGQKVIELPVRQLATEWEKNI